MPSFGIAPHVPQHAPQPGVVMTASPDFHESLDATWTLV